MHVDRLEPDEQFFALIQSIEERDRVNARLKCEKAALYTFASESRCKVSFTRLLLKLCV